LQYLLGQKEHAARTAIGASQRFDLCPFHEVVFGFVGAALDDIVTDDRAEERAADDATDDEGDLVGVRVVCLQSGRAALQASAHLHLLG